MFGAKKLFISIKYDNFVISVIWKSSKKDFQEGYDGMLEVGIENR